MSSFAETLSAESLRWTLGLYCAFVGAFMLVAPHRFLGPQYQGLAPYRVGWGMLALAGGVALLAIAILRPRLPLRLLGHGLAGASLLALAHSFAGLSFWTGPPSTPCSAWAWCSAEPWTARRRCRRCGSPRSAATTSSRCSWASRRCSWGGCSCRRR